MTTTIDNPSKKLEDEVLVERQRLSSDRMDISFGELINLYKNGELKIRPEYQRLYRWTNVQKTALIESILLGIPIPPIFVAEDEDGVWELVDGLQRVSTFISFFGELETNVTSTEIPSTYDDIEEIEEEEQNSPMNKWILGEGSLVSSLLGYNIDTLPNKLKINLKRAVCRVEILRGESKTEMKYELFKRLNSGGSKATAQEIRNAIYRAVNPQLNELILQLSKNTNFIKLTGLSTKKRGELYDQELILRFVAFYNNAENVNDNTEKYLDKFMEKTIKDTSFNYDFYKNIFVESINLINNLDDVNVFKTQKGLFIPSEYEAIMIGVAQNIEFYKQNKAILIEKVKELKQDTDFKTYSGTASNSTSRIKNRLKRVSEIFKNHP